MYVIVGGAGEVGREVARALRAEGHEVCVVDKDAERLEKLSDADVATVKGNVASKQVLEGEARVKDAQLFVAVTQSDEVNMLSCALAKTYGCRTLARINDTEYLNVPSSTEYGAVGIDVAICPEMVAAIRVKRMLNQPGLRGAEAFLQGKVFIAEGRVAAGSFVAGKRLDEVEPPPGFHLFAVYRDEDVLLPKPSLRLQGGDRMLMALSSLDVLRDVETYIGNARPVKPAPEVKRVMIAGASRVGIQIARLLEQSRRDVVLVEKDPVLAREAGDKLQKTLIVQGDVTDRHLLVQENVDTFDAFVGASKVEEYNTLGALLARQLGVPLTVVLVNQPELKPTLEALGIDLAVAPRLSTVGAMLQHVRGNAEEVALQNLGHERLVVLKVGDGAPILGQKVRKVPFPEDAILAALVRDGQVILPRGEDTVEAGDEALVFTTHPSAEALERLFS